MTITLVTMLFFTQLFITTNPKSFNTISNIHHHDHGSRGNETDYHVLLAIKAQISDDPNSAMSSWNNSLHFCQWRGITCGRKHRRVVSLRLQSNNLVGTLSPFVGNLSFIRVLNLSINSFKGDIPHQISRLPRLRYLALASNSFEGEIPANLSSCLHLTTLILFSNNLVGRIPIQLATLPNLVIFNLHQNYLSGSFQDTGIGNMSNSLRVLDLSSNHLKGSIPYDIGRLKEVDVVSLGDNILSGTIPASLYNLSNLKYISLSNTKISGHLSQDLGIHLSQLGYLGISNTSLTGHIPTSLSNLSKLEILVLSRNSFTGKFSLNGNNLPNLYQLNIFAAFSMGGEARDMSFLDTLTNCTNLESLIIAQNSFAGIFPQSILNLSITLKFLVLADNYISGQIPFGLSKFVNLYGLSLDENHFTGPIPSDVGKLISMSAFTISYNNISGKIPPSLGNLTLLSILLMGSNNLEGSLPKSLGKCSFLEQLDFSFNKFSGVLPMELFHLSSLTHLSVAHNKIQGSLPVEISSLKNLFLLDISQNMLFGEIPTTLGGCVSLTILDMSQNSFSGSIPEPLSTLKSIEILNLSCNKLSGQFPSFLSTWPYLSSLDLSFNALEGEVPIDGVFANTSVVSVVGNTKLCGGVLQLHLPRCPPRRDSTRRRLSLAMIVVISIACALIGVMLVALLFYLLCSSRKRSNAPSRLQDIRHITDVSYHMLSRATHGFSLSNLVGVGGFGSVYKGILHQDNKEMVVAVKVMNLENKAASKSFIVECNALRNIRHRNLVKIITACSSIDSQRHEFKALVYEFMPRGNLDSWLHSSSHMTDEHGGDNQSCSLSLFQRLSISIDVACALDYLHNECSSPIIHCDLKPTNILLDDEMVAHVGDFGLAKFLSGASTSSTMNNNSSTQVRGTVGYAAPEYGVGSKISSEGDIYSFGIIILEMMTSKKPTDPMFNDGLNLHDFVKSTLPDRVLEIIDQRMLEGANPVPLRTSHDIKKMECIKSLIEIGVQCSLEQPQERMNIKDVVNELKFAKQSFLFSRT